MCKPDGDWSRVTLILNLDTNRILIQRHKPISHSPVKVSSPVIMSTRNEHAHQLHAEFCSTETFRKLHIYLSGEFHRGRSQLHTDVSRTEKLTGH